MDKEKINEKLTELKELINITHEDHICDKHKCIDEMDLPSLLKVKLRYHFKEYNLIAEAGLPNDLRLKHIYKFVHKEFNELEFYLYKIIEIMEDTQ